MMGENELVLQGQNVRTQYAYAPPLTIECDVVLEGRAAGDGSFDLYFLPVGQPLDVSPARLTRFHIVYSNTGEYGSADRLEIDRRDGARNFVVWTEAPFKVEVGKVYRLKVSLLSRGKLNISINDVDFRIPDAVSLPYHSFQIQLGGWQPTNRWHVRHFSIH